MDVYKRLRKLFNAYILFLMKVHYHFHQNSRCGSILN